MKTNKLGLSQNFFSTSKSRKYKKKFSISEKATSTKVVLPIYMSLKGPRRSHNKKTTKNDGRKKTNRIYKLHKIDKNRKALALIKKELEQKTLGKYANPYIKNLDYTISLFSKEKKILFYDYYQICYILDKKKCDLYSRYKDYKLIYDNQEYFLKYFSLKESKVYLTYLFYVTYSKDSFVKSTRAVNINKDIDIIKAEYKEHIIKNVFNATRLILSRDLNKYLPNLDIKIYEKAKEKLSRIAIPKYKLDLKPVIEKRINYIYIKDVPITKIPKIIPNYSKQDIKLYSLIKSFLFKKKYSILIINGKKIPKGKKDKKYISRELSKDNNILNTIRTNGSEDEETTYNPNLSYISNFYTKYNINKMNINLRNKKNKDINDIESLIYRIKLKKEEKESENNKTENNALASNPESLQTITENDSEIFLSTLKKPFIGNREGRGLNNVKFKEMKRSESDNKEINGQLLLYTMEYLNNNKKEIKDNKKFRLFMDLYEDQYNFNKNKENVMPDINKEKIVKNYFPERFINPKKYKKYLIKCPFLKTVYKISDSFNSQNKSDKNKIYHLLKNNLTENKKISGSFSSDKNNSDSFKATYKFLLGINKKEKRDDLINSLVNKSNKIYNQIKTISEAEEKRSNFKKSGAFAFTSFKGSNFDKNENEWDVGKNYFKAYYGNTSRNAILMRKIDKENKKKDEYFKKCTTFNQIIKSSNVYL